MTIGRVWTAAAAAWVLGQIVPILLKVIEDYRCGTRARGLEDRRKALIAEWGLEEESDR